MLQRTIDKINLIQADQPLSWNDDTIRGEVIAGMTLLAEIGQRIFPSSSSMNTDDEAEAMCRIFLDFRDYGYLDKLHGMSIYGEAAMEKAIPFVLAARPLASLSQMAMDAPKNPLHTLSACINAVFARAKLDAARQEQGAGPGYFEWGVFEENIEGLIVPGLTVYELSLLAGVSEQAIRNALLEKHAPRTIKNRHWYGVVSVDAKEAGEWLRTRAGFHSEDIAQAEGAIRVPVDKRGYFFNSKCRQSAGYKVGAKGNEKYCETFEQALEVLEEMGKGDVPRFRRPNENNRFGIVKGIRWTFKTPEELGLR